MQTKKAQSDAKNEICLEQITGIILAGGASLLTGFDERLMKETELAVSLTESPARAVIRGLGILYENPLALRRAILKSE